MVLASPLHAPLPLPLLGHWPRGRWSVGLSPQWARPGILIFKLWEHVEGSRGWGWVNRTHEDMGAGWRLRKLMLVSCIDFKWTVWSCHPRNNICREQFRQPGRHPQPLHPVPPNPLWAAADLIPAWQTNSAIFKLGIDGPPMTVLGWEGCITPPCSAPTPGLCRLPGGLLGTGVAPAGT